MNADSGAANGGNRIVEGSNTSSGFDQGRNQAYYQSGTVPQNFSANGSLSDNNFVHSQDSAGSVMVETSSAGQASTELPHYHHNSAPQLSGMSNNSMNPAPLLSQPMHSYSQGHTSQPSTGYVPQMPNLNAGLPQYISPDSMYAQHYSPSQKPPQNVHPVSAGPWQSSGLPSNSLQLPPGLVLSNATGTQSLNGSVGGGGTYAAPHSGDASSTGGGGAGLSVNRKPWHSPENAAIREFIASQIVTLLQQRRPNATEDWQQKLPSMGKRLEDALYGKANSLEEYKDTSTLKTRLQQLAQQMNNKNQNSRAPQPAAVPQQFAPQQQAGPGGPVMGATGPGQHSSQHPSQVPQVPPPFVHTQSIAQPHMQQSQQHSPQHQNQQQQQQQQQLMHPQPGNTSRTLAAVSSQYGTVPPLYRANSLSSSGSGGGSSVISAANSGGQMNNNGMSVIEGLPQYPQTMPMVVPGIHQQHQHPQYQQQQMPYPSPSEQMHPQGHGTVAAGGGGYDGSVNQQGYQQQPVIHPSSYQSQQQQHLPPQQQQAAYSQPPPQMYAPHPQLSIPQLPSISPPMISSQLQQPQHQQHHQHQSSASGPQDSESAIIDSMIDHTGGSTSSGGGVEANSGYSSSSGQQQQGKRPPSNQHSEEHRRQVLKQQQQRLLLLRHASKCPHENGRCPVTPHCASMKNLWKHIMGCKDQECKIPHCVSSRYVLSHYSKCKDVNCPVCGPVREAIRRNYQKSQLIIDMSNKPPAPVEPAAPAVAEKRPRPLSSAAPDRGGAMITQAEKKPRLVIPESRPATARANNPLDPISCALYSFTNEQIKAHIQNIQEGLRLSASGIRELCTPIIDTLFAVPHAYAIFGSPVDPVALGLTDYNEIIKSPMDLGTIKKRLDLNGYRDVQTFAFDVRLTFQNAMRYNPKNSDVYVLAKLLLKDFDTKFGRAVSYHESMMEDKRANKEACLVCGEISLKFEPPVYYCNGKCGGQRIRRNSYFYSAGNNQYHWCTACFGELKEGQLIQLPDCTISKAELAKNKKKHSEESEEPWVQCDCCERWVHQICGLFNGRRNLGDSVSYMCPTCLMEKRKNNEGLVSATTKKMQAVDLPRTTLSDFIERRMAERLEQCYIDTAFKLNQTIEEVEKCPQLVLRQVSCFDKNQGTREAMLERYKSKNYPAEFPCRTKCIVLFQNIDGQDTLLFGMYVYEYGHKCSQPNQRRCYVSYLDSVHYFRPKQYRTVVYHEILVAYLEYMKARGFHTAHIWACPPLKGDDYILYVHPQDQKTPKDDKLRKWYVDMLQICQERGIMEQVTDIYTEYLADPSNDATVLPYFEGDYWVSEAEVIIRDLANSGGVLTESVIDELPEENAGDKSKRKGGPKAKRTRSSRGASTGVAPLSLGGKVDRDPVMAKLASIIEPMKDAFFVCRMHSKEFIAECALRAQREAESALTSQSKAIEKKRDEDLHNEALQGNEVSINSNAPHSVTAAQLEQAQASKKLAAQSSSSSFSDTGVIESKDDNETPADFASQSNRLAENTNGVRPWHGSVPDGMRQRTVENVMRVKREKGLGAGGNTDELLRALAEEARKIETLMYSRAISLEEYSSEGLMKTCMAEHADAASGMTMSSLPAPPGMTAMSPTPPGEAPTTTTPPVSASSTVLVNTSWHSSEHIDVRKEISNHIADLLRAKNPQSTNEEWVKSIMDKTRRLEAGLYNSASSLEEYCNRATIKQRLQQVVKSISDKANAYNAAKAESREESLAASGGGEGAKTEPVPAKAESSLQILENGLPKFGDDTEDVDDVQESEHFDTRQSFLNLCQGNHYQFDQLRRAKHTSMMVLYHLHNPDAPKFVPSCINCHKDILVGNRHHCDACDVDFCDDCYNLNGGPRMHPQHPLRRMATSSTTAPPKQVTEEQRRERQRNVALHLQLLVHASCCNAESCSSKNCLKMKDFLKHGNTCKDTIKKGCPLCKRIHNLLQLHARQCKLERCPVPKCREIREHVKLQTMRQQAMDDRRRAMMNEMYSRPGGAQPSSVVKDEAEEE